MSSQFRLSLYGALATIGTSLSLISVFSGLSWLVPVVGGILIVAGACAAVRRSPLPSAFEPIAAALGVLIWVTLLYAHSDAWLGLIPTSGTFRELHQLAQNGFDEIHREPTPVPANHGVVMLAVTGIAAIALVVDLLTVTLRRAALSGLPLLALFTVCAATGHGGVDLIAFITSSIGYLWLLYADNREKVARWGAAVGTNSRARPASTWSTDPAAAPAPASLGRQVGAVAISVGVVLPIFIPGLHTGINRHSGGGSGGHGGGSINTFDPLVKVGSDLASRTSTPVLTYRTSAIDPGYLRLTSLDVFNGRSFTENSLTAPSSATASESLPISPPTGPVVSTSTAIAPTFQAHWLPVQTTTLGVNVGDQWRYDPTTQTVFSATTNTQDLNFTSRSISLQPTAKQLEAVGRPTQNFGDLTLPRDLDPAIARLTNRITKGATSRYQAALDLQHYFTDGNGFHYDTNIPAYKGTDALSHFLFVTKRGFCQQYAAAMTVMARQSGIPARVAVGFTRGRQAANQSWNVTTHDAHAWPELWFQGVGWLAFEPTPRGDGQAVAPAYTQQAGHKNGGGNNKGAGGDTIKTGKGNKGTSKGQTVRVPGQGDGKLNAGIKVTKHHHRATDVTVRVLWGLLILAAVLLIVPGISRVITRRRRLRRLRDPIVGSAAAWAELHDTAIDFRLPWPEARSPREVATALLGVLNPSPTARDAMLAVAKGEERARYAPSGATAADLKSDLATVRAAMANYRSWQARVRARALPRSAVLAGRATAGRGMTQIDRGLRVISPVRAAHWLARRLDRREQPA